MRFIFIQFYYAMTTKFCEDFTDGSLVYGFKFRGLASEFIFFTILTAFLK